MVCGPARCAQLLLPAPGGWDASVPARGWNLTFLSSAHGDDLLWAPDRWQSLQEPRSKAHDPHQVRLKSYRVFLSRGRDGVVVFVPPEPVLDATYQALIAAGMHAMKDD